MNLTPLTGNYDPHSSSSVFTVSIDASNDNPALGLKEGSYSLNGNDTDGWSVEILDEVIMKVTASGGKYLINGIETSALKLTEGKTYIFDWSEAQTHPLAFSRNEDGTHSGGTEYNKGVIIDSNNYKTIINVKPGTPDLYYYCGSHSGMGAGIETLSFQNLKTVEYKVLFNNDLLMVNM